MKEVKVYKSFKELKSSESDSNNLSQTNQQELIEFISTLRKSIGNNKELIVKKNSIPPL